MNLWSDLDLIQGVIFFVSLTALEDSLSSRTCSPQAQLYTFRVWASKFCGLIEKDSWKKSGSFCSLHLMDIDGDRQPGGSMVCMDMLPSINMSHHITEQIQEDMFGLVTAKNQGAFAEGIQNKWKLCLRTPSCSYFAIFFIASSVKTLSCWDNWEGFHISASSRIADVECVNKGKHACTSYLMHSSSDIKERCGKPFNIFSLDQFSPPSGFTSFWRKHVVKM